MLGAARGNMKDLATSMLDDAATYVLPSRVTESDGTNVEPAQWKEAGAADAMDSDLAAALTGTVGGESGEAMLTAAGGTDGAAKALAAAATARDTATAQATDG